MARTFKKQMQYYNYCKKNARFVTKSKNKWSQIKMRLLFFHKARYQAGKSLPYQEERICVEFAVNSSLYILIVMLGRLIRPSKKVIKIKIEGPLDTKLQQSFIAQFPKISPAKTEALIIIVNSYGGSLPVARHIAAALRLIQQKLPVYCFAEQFCLNSANLILTSGTECYANKLSVIGDFGYAMEQYSGQQLNKRYNVGVEAIGNTTKPIDIYFQSYQINGAERREKMVQDLANQLKKQVIASRENQMRSKKVQNIDRSLLQGGALKPDQAVELGLIDGLHSQNQFIEQRLSKFKVEKKALQYDSSSQLRNVFQMFKQQ